MHRSLPPPARQSMARDVARHLACVLALGSALVAQTSVTIPCDRDNTLYESATGVLSNGVGMGVFVGVTGQPLKHRGLYHFNVAAFVPAGARIVSAVLSINTSRSSVGTNFPADVHRVLADWGEGTSNATLQEGRGATATTNDATWRHARYPNTLWTTPGGDFAPVPDCTMYLAWFGPAQSPTTAGMNATVQSWLDQPSQNFGWLLKTNELVPYLSFRLDSREAPAPGIKPVLNVRYVLPGQTAAPWGQGCLVQGAPFRCALVGAPTSGTTATWTLSNGPAGALAANLLTFGLDPIGSLLHPQCACYLPLGSAVITLGLFALDGSGTGSQPLAIPPGYPGAPLTGQSAALDGSAVGFVLSNAWVALTN